MTFTVFGYNFPHWKTQNGLINLFLNGFVPDMVILQNRKELIFKQSEYRITPKGEYLQEPSLICRKFGFRYCFQDHDQYNNKLMYESEYGVILGARILKEKTIKQYKGILNIHPGILPGNRGLDNLKWSIINGLPIGATAHFIDHRIDMGRLILSKNIIPEPGESIRDIYIRQRNLEQDLLIKSMELIKEGLKPEMCEPIPYSKKFDAVPVEPDYNKILNICQRH